MIEFSVVLPGSRERAFDLFTGRITDWWPHTHRLTNDPASRITLSADGTFRERASDGREMDLGRVRLWVRPARLELDFYLGTGPDHPTDVTVTFEQSGTSTRIMVQHRPRPSSTAIWNSRVSQFQASWPAVLESCVQHGDCLTDW